jgi:peroxiredoxin Q/BCP
VPQAGSPSCTAELCALDADRAQLDACGIDVLMISPDDVDTQQRWAHGKQVALASDPHGSFAHACGVDGRVTVLVDPHGRIAHVIADVDVDRHARQIVAALARLQAPARPIGAPGDLVVIRRNAQPGSRA